MEKIEVDLVYVASIITNAQHYAAFGFESKEHKNFYENALEIFCKAKIINEVEYQMTLSKVKRAKIRYNY